MNSSVVEDINEMLRRYKVGERLAAKDYGEILSLLDFLPKKKKKIIGRIVAISVSSGYFLLHRGDGRIFCYQPLLKKVA